MKDDKIDYTMRLIIKSKNGGNSSFLELANILLLKIYPVIFSLVPKENIAVQISLKVLLRAKHNIHNLEKQQHFYEWLKKLSIIESMQYLRNVEHIELKLSDIDNFCEEYYINLKDVEKEFLLLTCKERVVLSLTEIADLNSNQIAKIMKDLDENGVLDTVRNARNKLIKRFPFDEVRYLSEVGWEKLNRNLQNLDAGTKLEINDFELELIYKYISYSRSILHGILKHLIPSEVIISELRNELHKFEEYLIEEEQKGKKYEKIKTAKSDAKDLYKKDKKSNETSEKTTGFSIQPLLEKYSKKLKSVELLIVSIFLIYVGYNFFAHPGFNWSIEKSRGNVELIPSSASHHELIEGDEIVTGNNSVTTLKLSNIASLNVYPKTRLLLFEVSGTKNYFKLKTGKVEFNALKTEHENTFIENDYNYTFQFSDGIVNLNNANFSLEKTSTDFYLNVSAGCVNIEHNGKNIFLVKNYTYSKNLIAPYHIEASEVFVNKLKKSYNKLLKGSEIQAIVESATEKDAFTLWHLFYLTLKDNRKMIVEKLDEFYPITTMGFRENLLQLDEVTMNNLKEFLYNNIYRDNV